MLGKIPLGLHDHRLDLVRDVYNHEQLEHKREDSPKRCRISFRSLIHSISEMRFALAIVVIGLVSGISLERNQKDDIDHNYDEH